MYVSCTYLSLSIYMPASSGLGKPPSRTLLLHYVSFRTDPLLSTISTTAYSHVLLTDLYLHTPTQQKYTINTLNSNNSRNYINPRNTLVHLNTVTKRLYHIYKTRPHSTRTNIKFPDSTCHRKRPPPVKAQISYDDNMRSLKATPDHCLRSVSCTMYNPRPHDNIRSTYPNSYDCYTCMCRSVYCWLVSMCVCHCSSVYIAIVYVAYHFTSRIALNIGIMLTQVISSQLSWLRNVNTHISTWSYKLLQNLLLV